MTLRPDPETFLDIARRQAAAEAVANVVKMPAEEGRSPKHAQGSNLSLIRDSAGAPSIDSPRYLGLGRAALREGSHWSRLAVVPSPADPAADAFNRLVDLKVATAGIAMHLDGSWRTGLFRQLDDLLDDETWHEEDTLPTRASFRTFLRLIVMLGLPRRPSLGCSDSGNIIASWRREEDRLTIECRPDDEVRWVLARRIAGEPESAAGFCKLNVLRSRLSPYGPEVWFVADDEHPRR